MSNRLNPVTNVGQSMIYQIRIQGHLHSQWADWFEGLTILLEVDGNTLLTGPVVDQPALYGLLKKVRDLGMPLISVNPISADESHIKQNFLSSKQNNSGEIVMKAIVYTKPPDYWLLLVL